MSRLPRKTWNRSGWTIIPNKWTAVSKLAWPGAGGKGLSGSAYGSPVDVWTARTMNDQALKVHLHRSAGYAPPTKISARIMRFEKYPAIEPKAHDPSPLARVVSEKRIPMGSIIQPVLSGRSNKISEPGGYPSHKVGTRSAQTHRAFTGSPKMVRFTAVKYFGRIRGQFVPVLHTGPLQPKQEHFVWATRGLSLLWWVPTGGRSDRLKSAVFFTSWRCEPFITPVSTIFEHYGLTYSPPHHPQSERFPVEWCSRKVTTTMVRLAYKLLFVWTARPCLRPVMAGTTAQWRALPKLVGSRSSRFADW